MIGNSITCPGEAAPQRKGGRWKKGENRCLAAKGTPALVGFAQLMDHLLLVALMDPPSCQKGPRKGGALPGHLIPSLPPGAPRELLGLQQGRAPTSPRARSEPPHALVREKESHNQNCKDTLWERLLI